MSLPSPKVRDAASQRNFELLGEFVVIGTGDPEGRVPAPVGATYHRRDAETAASSALYVKQTGGSGPTGWIGK